jgi:Holliday junction resolvase-like predicted endonuclease
VWHVSDGLSEQRRWIDLPAQYVERALRTRLRETPGLWLTDDPRAAALHLDVVAFDDVLTPIHVANVALAVALEDRQRGRLLERDIRRASRYRGR